MLFLGRRRGCLPCLLPRAGWPLSRGFRALFSQNYCRRVAYSPFWVAKTAQLHFSSLPCECMAPRRAWVAPLCAQGNAPNLAGRWCFVPGFLAFFRGAPSANKDQLLPHGSSHGVEKSAGQKCQRKNPGEKMLGGALPNGAEYKSPEWCREAPDPPSIQLSPLSR